VSVAICSSLTPLALRMFLSSLLNSIVSPIVSSESKWMLKMGTEYVVHGGCPRRREQLQDGDREIHPHFQQVPKGIKVKMRYG
jgi:hypothetical protein